MKKYTVHALADRASAPLMQCLIAPGRPAAARGGVAARMLVGRVPLTVGPSTEESAIVVLAGTVAVIAGPAAGRDLSANPVLCITPDTQCRLAAKDGEPAVLLLVSGLADAAAGRAPYPGDAAADGDGSQLLRVTGGFSDMGVRWLATRAFAGCRSLAVATSTFRPDGSHDLHRHPHADEFFLVLDGGGEHLTEAGPVQLGVGDLAYIPAGEWHGFRTRPGVTTRTLYGYLGAGSLDEAGYHLRRVPAGKEAPA